MPKIDIVNCKTESSSLAFPFVLAMANENTIADNISVFENININQLGLIKDNIWFNGSFYI